MIARKDPGSEKPYNNDINPPPAAGIVTGGKWWPSGLPDAVLYASAAGYV